VWLKRYTQALFIFGHFFAVSKLKPDYPGLIAGSVAQCGSQRNSFFPTNAVGPTLSDRPQSPAIQETKIILKKEKITAMTFRPHIYRGNEIETRIIIPTISFKQFQHDTKIAAEY
jgi:hypothetical protein